MENYIGIVIKSVPGPVPATTTYFTTFHIPLATSTPAPTIAPVTPCTRQHYSDVKSDSDLSNSVILVVLALLFYRQWREKREEQKQKEEHELKLEKKNQAKTMKVFTSQFKAWIKDTHAPGEWENYAKLERLLREKRERMARSVYNAEDSADVDSES